MSIQFQNGGADMDWPKFAKKLLLADGRISELETDLLRRAILADKVVDREEVEFLAELKREAVTVSPEFNRFLYDVLKRVVLVDGAITDQEARWLRRIIFSDRQVKPIEATFVEDLKREARKVGPEFEALCRECLQLDASQFSRS